MLKFNLSKRRQAPPFYVTISPMIILRIGSKPVTNSKSPSLRRLPKRPSTHTGSDAANHKSANFSAGPVPHVREYSREAFVDAIVEWIVADDQVCSFPFLIIQ